MKTVDTSGCRCIVVGLIAAALLGTVSQTALARPSVAGTRFLRLANGSLVIRNRFDDGSAAAVTQQSVSGSASIEPASDDPLLRAKELYWSAWFDEALALLDRLKIDLSSARGIDVAVYRLLCLVALERQAQAQEAIESIVRADPLYEPKADMPPRASELFRVVRRGLLPSIIQQAYANANAAFDRPDPEAAGMFDRLLALVNDPDVVNLPELAELRASAARLRDQRQAASAPQRLANSRTVLSSDPSPATAGAPAPEPFAANVSSPSASTDKTFTDAGGANVSPSIAPSPPIAPAAGVSARGAEANAVYEVLNRYVSAFNSLDARAAATVWPSLDARTLARAFSQLAEQELTFDVCQVEITGAHAVASCQGRARYLPKIGSKVPRARDGRWTFKLGNTAERWMIEGVVIR